jgi:hypothetical protein
MSNIWSESAILMGAGNDEMMGAALLSVHAGMSSRVWVW